jgi:hypothetical protein
MAATEAEQASELYVTLKPEAIADARTYVLSRTPAELQTEMEGVIAADFPPPPAPPAAA